MSSQARNIACVLGLQVCILVHDAVVAASSPRGGEAVLDQLQVELGGRDVRPAIESRLGAAVALLSPTFGALPKNAHGALSPSAARYAMHSYYVRHYSWHIKGLAYDGQPWSSAKPALGLAAILPANLCDRLEELGVGGFDLEELALLAATLEVFVQHHETRTFQDVLAHFGYDSQRGTTDKVSAMLALEKAASAYLLSNDFKAFPVLEQKHKAGIENLFPQWHMVREIIEAACEELAPGLVNFTFADLGRVFDRVREKLGKFIDASDCHALESQLLAIEEGNGTGRVTLHDFYEGHVRDGIWGFQERPDYLRQLGVLDESDPSGARLLVPNYLAMQANCIHTSSRFYDICCTDSCGDLLGHLESRLQAPHASPEIIMSTLSETQSPHSPPNRSWSRALVSKLEEIAVHHEGQVPLHGRLFAQWLHFAYPRECMYPHVSDTVSAWTASQWLEETGVAAELSLQEMKDHIALGASTPRVLQSSQEDEEEMCFSMWSPEEELVDPVHGRVAPPPTGFQEGRYSSLRQLLSWGAVAAVILSSATQLSGLLQNSLAVLRSTAEDKVPGKASDAYYV